MGNEIAKRYSVDQKPTSSGGHGYLWKAHDAVRKKDGAECSVFVFQKSDLERRLKGHGPLAQRVLAVMAKDAAILGELCGMEEQKTKKAEPSSGAAGLFSSAVAMAGVAVGADFSVKTAKARSPRGILQVYEVVESRTVLAFVGERVACSLGNVLHKMWPGVAPDDVPRDWLSIELTAAEVLRGGASACEALEALRAGAGPLRRRWVHLGLGPEAIWLTKSGDWRVAGFGLAQLVEDGRFDAASPFFQGADNEAWTPADGPELNLLTAGPRLTYSAPEITVDSQCQRRVTPAADVFALGAVLYEALGRAASRSFPPLLDGCGDSVYKHRSLVAQRLAENLRLDALPPQATDCVQRALAPMAEIRPDAHAMRGSPAFHTPLVKALRELDVLHLRDSSQVIF
ncbi:kinase-like domain-containing protein [Pelagophyceae sp. CCMP2097]|nr:kinase-like domain-containing protein [Pelagophyceae sp. CCMP2097]